MSRRKRRKALPETSSPQPQVATPTAAPAPASPTPPPSQSLLDRVKSLPKKYQWIAWIGFACAAVVFVDKVIKSGISLASTVSDATDTVRRTIFEPFKNSDSPAASLEQLSRSSDPAWFDAARQIRTPTTLLERILVALYVNRDLASAKELLGEMRSISITVRGNGSDPRWPEITADVSSGDLFNLESGSYGGVIHVPKYEKATVELKLFGLEEGAVELEISPYDRADAEVGIALTSTLRANVLNGVATLDVTVLPLE